MTVKEVIARADELRPNALGEEQKVQWLRQLDAQLWEVRERDEERGRRNEVIAPYGGKVGGFGTRPYGGQAGGPGWPWEMTWPEEDPPLLFTGSYEELYQHYLMAKIDYYNQETDLYLNDMAAYNGALGEAMAWWRRHHRPQRGKNWRTI